MVTVVLTAILELASSLLFILFSITLLLIILSLNIILHKLFGFLRKGYIATS